MQPLYTEAEFKAAKSRQPLPFRCHHCTQTYYRPKNRILADLGHSRKTSRKRVGYCSLRCARLAFGPPVTFRCEQCNTQCSKSPKEIKRTKHHFCSQSCAAKWNNAHKTKGTRVSKLEKWLQEQLPVTYPALDFHFNRKDAINGELDIFIPSLKLAFELNGIFHYEPIYGPEKLAKMQTNDTRKAQACLERGIELCIIDTSHQKYFKEPSAMKFLDIIRGIIDAKLSGSSPVASDCLASTT